MNAIVAEPLGADLRSVVESHLNFVQALFVLAEAAVLVLVRLEPRDRFIDAARNADYGTGTFHTFVAVKLCGRHATVLGFQLQAKTFAAMNYEDVRHAGLDTQALEHHRLDR